MVHVQSGRSAFSARLPDHYKTLGLSPIATFSEVQRAYWRLAFGGLSAGDRAALNEAYDVLGNDLRRREYDAQRPDVGQEQPEQTAVSKTARPAPRPDAGLRGKLGWPSV